MIPPLAAPLLMESLKLKEKIVNIALVDYDLSSFMYHSDRYCKSPTMRLRDLDSIRLHNPVPEEISLLNISSYRMNMHNLNDLLYLCGGLVGMRFTSEELLLVVGKSKRLLSIWNALDDCYKAMSPSSRKLIVHASELKPLQYQEAACSDGEFPVIKFHVIADEYVQELTAIQSLMRLKQSEIDPSASQGSIVFCAYLFVCACINAHLPSTLMLSSTPYYIRGEGNQLKMDADPESKIGTKTPLWLSTLMELFERSKSPVDNASGIQQSRCKLNVAELSLFLCDYMLSGAEKSPAISESLSEVRVRSVRSHLMLL